ncbi:MAG: hypothetical protein HZA89_00705 [Verrucomicrobia bacterium]|nr:hypothetical protein [Verrucomicrobiota bacterium]
MKAPKLFLVRLYARPRPKSKFAKKYGGAYVNCLVNFLIARGAEVVAKDIVAQNGWTVSRRIVTKIVTRKDYKRDKQLEAYFDEALKLGISTVFHCHPPKKAKKEK